MCNDRYEDEELEREEELDRETDRETELEAITKNEKTETDPYGFLDFEDPFENLNTEEIFDDGYF